MFVKTLLSVLLIAHFSVGENSPSDVKENAREGRFFPSLHSEIWRSFKEGIKNSRDVIERLSSNLEVAFDQINPTEWPLNIAPVLFDEPINDEGIAGSIGGVDDDHETIFHYQKEDENADQIPDGTEINPAQYPNPNMQFPNHRSGLFDLDSFRHPLENLKNIFEFTANWWKKENVCVDREEIDETESNKNSTEETAKTEKPDTSGLFRINHFGFEMQAFGGSLEMTTCRDNKQTYTCTTKVNKKGLHKTIKVTHRCCHGFIRDVNGCTKVELLPMVETLDKLEDARDFLSLLKTSSLLKTIEGSNLTIFAPSNEAVEEYTSNLDEKNEINSNVKTIGRYRRSIDDMSSLLRGHMVNDFYFAADMQDEQILNTLTEGAKLRINIYGGTSKTMTVNCARIIRGNQHSENGVVHTIDRVLEPTTKSLNEIIEKDPQFSIFKKLLAANSGLSEILRNPGQLTLLAPTNSAFRRLEPTTLSALLEGNMCVEALIQQHILPNTICSSAIQGKMRTKNSLDKYLMVEKSEDDKMFIGDGQLVGRDTTATNGVMHIIDKVLLPDEAKSLVEVLEKKNLTHFLGLLKEADLMGEISRSGVTLFAPTNEAVEIFKPHLDKIRNNKEKLRELLQYHISGENLQTRNIQNNEFIPMESGHNMRFNFYSRTPILNGILNLEGNFPVKVTAGCSRVTEFDVKACGSSVHIIEEMQPVPEENVLKTIKENSDSTIFMRMLQETGNDKTLEEEGPFTVFAPSDHTFRNLPEEELNAILNDTKMMETIVQRHVLKEHICCSGINANNWLFMDRKRAIDGTPIHIRRTIYDQKMAGPARIIKCGNPSGNGVVHTVNRLILSNNELNRVLGKEQASRPGLKFSLPMIPELTRFFRA